MTELTIRPIDALTVRQLARVQAIYEGAFSQDLRVPFTDLTQPGDVDQTFVAMDGEGPTGLAALRLLRSADWTFLRYFAIDSERRSQGLGRHFWQLLAASLRHASWPARVVFEVEDPAEAADDRAERAIRERRIGFWTGCGARLLPASGYMLPAYTESGASEPMLLMAAGPAAEPAIRGARLGNLVLAIYTDRYGISLDDPLVSRALASIVT